MKTPGWGIVACMLQAASALYAQQPDKSQEMNMLLLEENLEQLAADEDYGWEAELEELSRCLQEPVNLNAATRGQLEQFPFLSDLQVENLLAYVYVHGQMQTVYELQLVEGMDKRTIGLLLPFVCVRQTEAGNRRPSLKHMLRYGRHEVLTRLDIPFYTRKGYETDYLGTPSYHSFRYGFHYSDCLQAGMAAEKDAGEPLFALHNAKGYDFYSFYFLAKNLGRLKALALGNYRLSFGQGLVVNSGFGPGKSFSLSTSEYRSGGVKKHASTDEYNYFRGAAATVGILPSLDVSAFYSHRRLDATVEEGEIVSVGKTGLHRTRKEADRRNACTMQLAGGNVAYAKNAFGLGATGICYFFDRPYEPRLREYARHNLHGTRFFNLGLDYRLRAGRLTWTGEAATGTKGYALLNRLRCDLAHGCHALLIHRFYSHDYWAWFARSFGEGGTPQNENGWYLAAEAAPLARWKLFASLDLFSFPWWRYRISKPSKGVDLMFQATYTPQEELAVCLNYRCKRKERDVTGTGGGVTLPVVHHKLRCRLTWMPGDFVLRTTADCNSFRQHDGEGFRFARRQGCQLTQLCTYACPRLPLSVSLQGTYFHTDDYDSRVCASERGLLYAFSAPSFFGRGFRWSAWLRCDLRDSLTLTAKLGQTAYRDRDETGSGNDLIRSSRKTDLQTQLRLMF